MASEIRVDTIKNTSGFGTVTVGTNQLSLASGLILSTQPFIEMNQNINANYTISSSVNALTAGPVAIATGITVTIPTGSNWVVV